MWLALSRPSHHCTDAPAIFETNVMSAPRIAGFTQTLIVNGTNPSANIVLLAAITALFAPLNVR